MSDIQLTPEEQELVNKYKTLARAIAANDGPACRIIHKVFEQKERALSHEEVAALGFRWLANKNNEPYSVDIALFLNDLGFDFEQVIILDQKNENSGTAIPFRLLTGEHHQQLLLDLLNNGIVPLDTMDGMGDSLLVEALLKNEFDFAQKLLDAGVDIQATNMAGQTALHVCANKVNFRACEFLCRNGIDPTIEDLNMQRASEMVPEAMPGWNVDCLFNDLEQYVDDFRNGQPFVASLELQAMMRKETPKESEGDDMTLGEQADEAQSVLSGLNAGP